MTVPSNLTACKFAELMATLSDEECLHFYELFAHNLTVIVREFWSDPSLSDREKVERMKSINEILHRVTSKVWIQRRKTHTWSEIDFGSFLESTTRDYAEVAGALSAAAEWAYAACRN